MKYRSAIKTGFRKAVILKLYYIIIYISIAGLIIPIVTAAVDKNDVTQETIAKSLRTLLGFSHTQISYFLKISLSTLFNFLEFGCHFADILLTFCIFIHQCISILPAYKYSLYVYDRVKSDLSLQHFQILSNLNKLGIVR